MKKPSGHQRNIPWICLMLGALLYSPLAIPGSTLTAAGAAMESGQVQESVIAGSWYPSSASALREQLEGFFEKVPVREAGGRPVALIVPHAGYAYSGQVAAHAYKLLQKHKFDSIVIIAPSHHARFSGVSVYDLGGFKTPLGVVPLDDALIKALIHREKRIRSLPEAHAKEHSLEIQLPFLQLMVPGFRLVPLVMGQQDMETCRWLSETLWEVCHGKSVLVVASSDLSHYHPYDEAKRLDERVIDAIKTLDAEGLHDRLAKGDCEACGGGPLVTAMLYARKVGVKRGEVLNYANSGDVTGTRNDPRGVVGYVSAALWTAAQKSPESSTKIGTEPKKVGVDLGLTHTEKALLHKVARESIEARCRGADPPSFTVDSMKLKEPRGAFVTLHKHGKLRGCIGHIMASRPLVQTVMETAVAAAFEDPRFPPLDPGELKDIEVEISVLTPLERVRNPEEIRVGIHGIVLKKGNRSGLLLPQVATEQGWDRTSFLENCCLKAGLLRDAWRDADTEIYIFSADVF